MRHIKLQNLGSTVTLRLCICTFFLEILTNIKVSFPNLAYICLDLGINRIGVAGTFIHIDVDPDKSPNVLWTY